MLNTKRYGVYYSLVCTLMLYVFLSNTLLTHF